MSEGRRPDRQLGAEPVASALIRGASAGACDFESWASGFDRTQDGRPSALLPGRAGGWAGRPLLFLTPHWCCSPPKAFRS